MNNILITNVTVLPMTESFGRPYFKGAVGISGDKIAFVSEDDNDIREFRSKYAGDIREIDGSGKLVMPGLVDTHNHISMTLMRGYADDMPLMTWLNDNIWPFEAKLQRSDIITGAELGIAEMLLGGITTSADMYWMQEAVGETAEKAGMRIVLCPTLTDFRYEDFKKDFEAVAERYIKEHHELVSVMMAPHSLYSCSEEHLLYARELSEKYGLGITIHISETQDEQQIIAERYGMTPVEYLFKLGMLTDKTLIVHAVWLSNSDIGLVYNQKASVAYNPQSNMKLSSGVAPVAQMVEAGINVCYGTDGPSSNNDLDMWDEMRTGSFLQKSASGNPCMLPAYQTLKMATVNGAKALGLGDKIGTLEAGKLADMIIIDMEQPHLYPQHDIVSNLVYAAKSSDVESVIIGGRMVVENRKIHTMKPIAELCHAAQEAADNIKKQLN